ncbi:MAG: TIGR02206 family membrane protein [Candidatus Izemoplasmatales bacterium]
MFDTSLQDTFVSYGLSHILAVIVVSVVIALVIIFKKQLRNERLFNKFRITLAVLILLQELSLHIFRIWNGTWSLATALPLHLCGLAVLSTAYVLLFQDKKYFYATFFVMMIGATLALLTPSIEGGYGFPHYRFFQFFISHGLIMINFTFILFVMDYQKDMKYKYLLYNFFSLAAFALFDLAVNFAVGGNYMYLMAKPGPNTAFDLFGEHPWYLINIFLFGIPVFFHIYYLPFFVKYLVLTHKNKELKNEYAN